MNRVAYKRPTETGAISAHSCVPALLGRNLFSEHGRTRQSLRNPPDRSACATTGWERGQELLFRYCFPLLSSCPSVRSSIRLSIYSTVRPPLVRSHVRSFDRRCEWVVCPTAENRKLAQAAEHAARSVRQSSGAVELAEFALRVRRNHFKRSHDGMAVFIFGLTTDLTDCRRTLCARGKKA